MRKQYQQPHIRTIVIASQPMLDSSVPKTMAIHTSDEGTVKNSTEILSRTHGTSVWDDEEE